MSGIFFQTNVYVFVWDDQLQLSKTRQQMEEDKSIIVYYGRLQEYQYDWKKSQSWLYGGRVCVNYSQPSEKKGYISIDGIELGYINHLSWAILRPLAQIVSILNEIEQLGVDAVLENYKKALSEQKKELEEKIKGLELKKSACQEEKFPKIDEDSLFGYQNILLHVISDLSALACLLYCGLTNMQYINAYNEVIATYFTL